MALAILYVDAERRRRNYRERVLDVVRELATYTESTAQETLQFEHRDWRDVVPEVQRRAARAAQMAREARETVK